MRNAGRGRRVGAFAAQLLLVPLSLIVGWLIWLGRLPDGQSPGKSLVGLSVNTTDGKPASTVRVALRELFNWLMIVGPVVMLILIPVLEPNENPGSIWATLTAVALLWLLVSLAGSATMLVLKDGRGVVDRIFGTVVVERED